MSLEATHLRFSLAIKDDLNVLDLEKYISGAVYPDTRYLTGIERNATHNLNYFIGRKNLSDFERGWLSHIVGDKVFYEVIEDKFGDFILFEDYQDRWAVLSAIKIIQDIKDFSSFDIRDLLRYLDYYEIHFHEDERKVVEYNHIIKSLYENKEKLIVENCLGMWKKLGNSDEKNARIRKKIIELYEEEDLVEKIDRNFEDGMGLYEERYKKLMEKYAKN